MEMIIKFVYAMIKKFIIFSADGDEGDISPSRVSGFPSKKLVPSLMLTLCLLASASQLPAQQLPVYSQFMFNTFIINPAVAGTHNYYQVRLNNRFQWTGITDAPQTNSLSVYGPHTSRDMGFGGYIFNDATGPTSRNGLYGSYAYNLLVKNRVRLAMGFSAGLLQNHVDGTKITLLDPSDMALINSVSSVLSPDAVVGVYLYSSGFHIGFSAHQLFGNTLNLFDEGTGLNKLKTHFFLTGGYKYYIGPDYSLEPSIIARGSAPTPVQAEFNLKASFRELIWLGFSARSQDALSFLVGYTHENRYHFGYSYDMSFSPIRNHNSGSHEIFVGMRFNPLK